MSSEQSLVLKAPAKVNLYLKITGKRPDGYHLLQSLMQKISLYDFLEINLTGKVGVQLSCSNTSVPEDESNLVHLACCLFIDEMERQQRGVKKGISVRLEKNIPVAAGLGGGSSDAATVLLGLNQLFSFPFNAVQLAQIGVKLGADVPFFLTDSAVCWAEGIGEKLCPMPSISNITFVIVNPGFPVSTKWVYENFALTNDINTFNLENYGNDWSRLWRDCASDQLFPVGQLLNDLEVVTANQYCEIDSLKNELIGHGALTAMMSGSGPTVFAVFSERQDAEVCCESLHDKYSFVCVADPLV